MPCGIIKLLFKQPIVKKILLIQTASIGDVILITPVMEALQQKFPEAHIDILIKKGNESLFQKHPFLRKIIIWDKSKNKYRNLWHILGLIQEERYDVVVNFQRFASSGLITAFSRAKKTVGFRKNPFSMLFGKRLKHQINTDGTLHETERNLSLVRHLLGDLKVCKRPRLYPLPQHEARMSPYKMQAYICIAPSSLWFTKEYPLHKWVDLLRQLPADWNVYTLGSGADKDKCETIIKESGRNNCINFAGQINLLESAALMRDAQMNIVNDSAPMHLASSVDAPVTAIFCSTVPQFGFGPLSKQSSIVETREKLNCRPCGLHGFDKCPQGHFKCGESIESDQILRSIDKWTKKRS